MRAVPPMLIKYLERVEGEKFYPYQDSAGTWTVGVGHTGDDVEHDPTVEWSQQDVDDALVADLAVAQKRLLEATSQAAIDVLNDCQYAAMLSFVFNVGAKPEWGIFGLILNGNLAGVPAQMGRFIYAGGRVIPGLVNRRADDVELWSGTAPECSA